MDDFNEGENGKLAARMRRVNPEQFHTLVKMHLSFELDLNTEDDCVTEKAKLKKWGLLSFSKKPKSTMNLQKGTEGAALTQEGITRVKQLIKYLSKEESILQEGIFRRTGKLTRQQDLKVSLYQGLPLNLDDGRYSVHDCASVLKGFLAELPEPLLTELHYPAHCQIAELCSSDVSLHESRLLRSLQLLLLLLPSENRILLKHLVNLLNKTSSYEHSNKMNCDTLATLFTPHLMCPRKLSPEALHINSQNLSGLVAFMIKKGGELFDIPAKLATDIRAYWLEQERKLLSPKKNDLNESLSDTTGTARTVFSFVDHKLTAKANSTQDTQAALAQLYAHIQAMPESAKKRRLVKQFNKENGQGTPRQVKHCRTKSLGDSIKKHIFQKKLLGHKKLIDINIGCNISRSSSEENMLSRSLGKSLLPSKTLFSRSGDELNADSYTTLDTENLLQIKDMSNSTGSLNTPSLESYKTKKKIMLMSFVNISEEQTEERPEGRDESRDTMDGPERQITDNTGETEGSAKSSTRRKALPFSTKTFRISRQLSEPPDMYSSQANRNEEIENELVRPNSDPASPVSRRTNMEVVFTPRSSMPDLKSKRTPPKSDSSARSIFYVSPVAKTKSRNIYAAHTSTPSNLLRRSLAAGDYPLTPMTDNDKSMSPITQSATKMTKAMQESMMTPRSRKPVMMVSGSNLCNLATLNNGQSQCESTSHLRVPSFNPLGMGCASILEESPKVENLSSGAMASEDGEATVKESLCDRGATQRNFVGSVEDDYGTTIQRSSVSMKSAFAEYLLSRSVLTTSPVDLSFTSRTGDFEQSESDLNILNNEDGLSDSLLHCLNGNNPESDTSGIASGSPNSANDSTEQVDSVIPSPRKRGTSLQRNDSKRSIMERSAPIIGKVKTAKSGQIDETVTSSDDPKDMFQETSF